MSLRTLLEIGATAADSPPLTVKDGAHAVIGLFTGGAGLESGHTAFVLQVTPGAPSPTFDDTGESLTLTKARPNRVIQGPRTVIVRRPAGLNAGVYAEA
ncbi:hypothetical protein J2X02_003476 [Pseudoxanthomonas japonensis]|uniref:hypothetical protein n=1 Tax=Pseudoxanthomonas japonensis TaxID=69284 RepID=UPI002855E6FD|nr:hypothetical protein [Pseudoxanthomonas japonensis]MDR7070611.1 hypothetical protein [Pseudoxanthomonas japonensis]